MRLLRTAVKGALLAAHVAAGAAVAALCPAELDERFVRGWCRLARAILGLRVLRRGSPADGPALVVANHLSWVEVVALGSISPLGFVAKDDVARWPLIGRLAAAAGTLFLRRGSAFAALDVSARVLDRLAQGRSVAVFPEGTSTSGETVLPFRSAMFEAPSRLGCDVQPVAIRYPADRRGRPSVAPFIGDDEFLPHLLRVLVEPGLDVELDYLPPISGHGRSRDQLAHAAREEIVAALERRVRVGAAPLPTF